MIALAVSEAANPSMSQHYISRHSSGDFPRVAEFFAGIGLVGLALEREGFKVVFSNDIDPVKMKLYAANHKDDCFRLADIHDLHGWDIPDVEVATASFPCTDLSLAGNRAGLVGKDSGTFWQFARVLDEMGDRRPSAVLLENVVGFATSHNGEDLKNTISKLNDLGYSCDILMVDARWFVPQSRPRLFVIGSRLPVNSYFETSTLRPPWLEKFVRQHRELQIYAAPLPLPQKVFLSLASVVEKLPAEDLRWWNQDKHGKFLASLSPIQTARLTSLKNGASPVWASAYRRTRGGKAVWEIRADSISGCLRTARGGSSKQALVEAGEGMARIRWMTTREYARLQGVPDFELSGVRESQAYFALGDAVCVPAVAWLGREYLMPLLTGRVQAQLCLLDDV